MLKRTTLDLYRSGNAATSRFDEVTTRDVTIQPSNGVDHVIAGSGGISTTDAIGNPKGKWWMLPVGSEYDDSALTLVNDYPGHWQWEPAKTMTVDEYRDALAVVRVKFTPTWSSITSAGQGKGRTP